MAKYIGFDPELGKWEYDEDTEEYTYLDEQEIEIDTGKGYKERYDSPSSNSPSSSSGGNSPGNNVPGVLNIGLDENNFIMKYMRYAGTLTDAYPEYHYATALSILSAIANRRIVCRLNIDTIYPNIWSWGLGISTYSKKSTAMKKGEEILDDCDIKNRMMEYYSPEGLVEFLDKNPRCYLWIDEAGQMLETFEKSYMGEMKDMMCRLYDNRGFSKKLRTSIRKNKQTEFHVTNPYITQMLMTTPDTFKSKTTVLDITSGWLLRYLYFVPEYTKPWMGARILGESDLINRKEIINRIKIKIQKINQFKDGNELQIGIENEGMDYWNNWQKKKYEDLGKSNDEYSGALIGRYQIYVIKLAMIFELGEDDWNWNKIKLKNIKEACRQVDEYFLPIARKLIEDIGTNEHKNIMDKINGILKRSGGKIYWSKLLFSCKQDKEFIKRALETMEEAGMVQWNRKRNLISIRQI